MHHLPETGQPAQEVTSTDGSRQQSNEDYIVKKANTDFNEEDFNKLGVNEQEARWGWVSNVELVGSQVIHEWLNQEVCGEVEDEAEGDGDGQRRQSFLEDSQEQQR